MLTYILPTRPEEVVRLLKAEIAATHGQPELCYSVWEDYLIKEHLDCRSLGGRNGEDYDLVSADAVLNIEPRLEQNYWMLKVVAHRDVGPQKICDAAALIGAKLTLEQFEAVLGDRDKVVTVRLDVSKPFARAHFNSWLDDLRARHRDKVGGVYGRAAAMAPSGYPANQKLPLPGERALWDKQLGERIIAWNKRSSARVERRLDRFSELVASMLTHISGRN
jgi:hypothetical protein